ncbi:uncharacterized protein UV8b_01961 [Ustilaginoidea virens]|uniref:Secondary alcohol dehydrogenase protein n=1 Tax=Ustilaginoidea virens TaxID=1159556 RepID=A0A063BVJ5_USTVR|nr:uncharacterized protein UV8b_01961 [Ustilaginoidea virens]QUC17720.1 hypothetical protein UV8b_01961 [Ustilaginoidea virens]GAO13966.1 hypothetical protein UVI_02035200 [Ustilaginoidea virens]
MSADTRPISPARFAAALKDLSTPMLRLKVLEIRNSIAHLRYSNDQLRPFAEGSATALGREQASSDPARREPDQDCVDAIRENELVIDRMARRIALVRAEVEQRGASWAEFQSKEEEEEEAEAAAADAAQAATTETHINGHADSQQTPHAAARHPAWTDGTFQSGTIRNGQIRVDDQPGGAGRGARSSGGTVSDEELRRAMEARMRDPRSYDDGGDGGSGSGSEGAGVHL